MFVLIWAAFAPYLVLVGVPLALARSFVLMFRSGAYLTPVQCFAPLFKLLCSAGNTTSRKNPPAIQAIAVAGVVFHFLSALRSFNIIYLPIPDFYYLGFKWFGIAELIGAFALALALVDLVGIDQKIWFVPKDRPEFRKSFDVYTMRSCIVYDWDYSTFYDDQAARRNSKEPVFITFPDGSCYDLYVYTDYADDLINCVAVELPEYFSLDDIPQLVKLLVYSFDNSASAKKVAALSSKLAGLAASNLGSPLTCGVQLNGYAMCLSVNNGQNYLSVSIPQ